MSLWDLADAENLGSPAAIGLTNLAYTTWRVGAELATRYGVLSAGSQGGLGRPNLLPNRHFQRSSGGLSRGFAEGNELAGAPPLKGGTANRKSTPHGSVNCKTGLRRSTSEEMHDK